MRKGKFFFSQALRKDGLVKSHLTGANRCLVTLQRYENTNSGFRRNGDYESFSTSNEVVNLVAHRLPRSGIKQLFTRPSGKDAAMKTMGVSEFKTHALKILDRISKPRKCWSSPSEASPSPKSYTSKTRSVTIRWWGRCPASAERSMT